MNATIEPQQEIQSNEPSKAEDKTLRRREKFRSYYHAHKDHIAEYRKKSGVAHKSYENYYEKNKERIRQRNLERYYERKAQVLPASESEKIEE